MKIMLIVLILIIFVTAVSAWITQRDRPMYMYIRHRIGCAAVSVESNQQQPSLSYASEYERTQIWKDKIQQLQQDAHTQRIHQRRLKNRHRLEDRARHLALRALRLHTRFQQQQQQQQHQQQTQYNHTKPITWPEPKWPSPSLSSSSTRRYTTKEDKLITETQRKLEQKLYGKRFQHAFKVYTRLLEALDQVRTHGKQQATHMVRLSQRKHMIQPNISYSLNTTRPENTWSSDASLLEVHQRHHQRMQLLIRLALHGKQHFLSFPSAEDHSIININPNSLDNIQTEDLLLAVKIRGNLKRKGARFSKKRHKVIQYFVESYSYSLW